MNDQTTDVRTKVARITRIGWVLTIAFLVIVASAALWNFSALYELKPNEWGDFLAGVSAPLAFFWLVLGFHLQRLELAAQANELRMNTEANNDQASQLKAQAELLRQQVAVMTNEAEFQRARDRRGATPRLRLDCIEYDDNVCQLKLANDGATAWQVRIRSYSGDWLIESWDDNQFITVDSDAAFDFRFAAKSRDAFDIGLNVEFVYELEVGTGVERAFFVGAVGPCKDLGTTRVRI